MWTFALVHHTNRLLRGCEGHPLANLIDHTMDPWITERSVDWKLTVLLSMRLLHISGTRHIYWPGLVQNPEQKQQQSATLFESPANTRSRTECALTVEASKSSKANFSMKAEDPFAKGSLRTDHRPAAMYYTLPEPSWIFLQCSGSNFHAPILCFFWGCTNGLTCKWWDSKVV